MFGPLGDQVGFILVLPALMSLVAARPIMFSVHVGALLLTGHARRSRAAWSSVCSPTV